MSFKNTVSTINTTTGARSSPAVAGISRLAGARIGSVNEPSRRTIG